jgi:hypothetical protein
VRPIFQPGQAFNDTYVVPGQLAGALASGLVGYRLGLNGVNGFSHRPGYWMLLGIMMFNPQMNRIPLNQPVEFSSDIHLPSDTCFE